MKPWFNSDATKPPVNHVIKRPVTSADRTGGTALTKRMERKNAAMAPPTISGIFRVASTVQPAAQVNVSWRVRPIQVPFLILRMHLYTACTKCAYWWKNCVLPLSANTIKNNAEAYFCRYPKRDSGTENARANHDAMCTRRNNRCLYVT